MRTLSEERDVCGVATGERGELARVPAVAQLARAEGAVLREMCAVRTLDVAGGQVVGVAYGNSPSKW